MSVSCCTIFVCFVFAAVESEIITLNIFNNSAAANIVLSSSAILGVGKSFV